MRRFLLRAGIVLAVLITAVVLAFRLSPWPAVAVITYMFAKNDDASEAGLQKHVPPGIVTRANLAYGTGGDEVFDLYYRDTASGPQPTIVWVHGGSFIAGSKSGIANYMRVLAGQGFTTIAVEYSKGYGTTYPKPVEQVNAALGFIRTRAAELNVDPSKLVLAGDSAGAHIASQVALLTTGREYARTIGISPALHADEIRAMLLFSGAYDPYRLNLDGDFGWFLRAVLWAYTGVKNFREDERFRLTSIPNYVTSRFPASFVSSGNGDPLEPQAVRLATRLSELGVRVETLFFPPDRVPSLPHEYQFDLDNPAGQEALRRLVGFLTTAR